MAKTTGIAAVMIAAVILLTSCATMTGAVKEVGLHMDELTAKYAGCDKAVQVDFFLGIVTELYIKNDELVCAVARSMSTGLPLAVWELIDGKFVKTWENPFIDEWKKLQKERMERLKKKS